MRLLAPMTPVLPPSPVRPIQRSLAARPPLRKVLQSLGGTSSRRGRKHQRGICIPAAAAACPRPWRALFLDPCRLPKAYAIRIQALKNPSHHAPTAAPFFPCCTCSYRPRRRPRPGVGCVGRDCEQGRDAAERQGREGARLSPCALRSVVSRTPGPSLRSSRRTGMPRRKVLMLRPFTRMQEEWEVRRAAMRE